MLEQPPSLLRADRFHNRMRAGVGAALSAVVLIALGMVLQSQRRSVHDYDSGPLQTGSDTSTSKVVELGQPFTFGGIVIYNKAERPAVLEEIRLVPPPGPGMEILAIEVAGGDRPIGYVGTDDVFPPPDLRPSLHPYRRAQIPPERTPKGAAGTEIVFGLRIDRAGNFGFKHVDIDYRVGKKRHRVRVEDGFLACAPSSSYPRGCDHETFFGGAS